MRNYHSIFNHVISYTSVLPFLYRYENANYIDDFFETGSLFISSFHNYRRYQDNQLGDKGEGSATTFGISDKNLTIVADVTLGMNDYSFCTSTVLDKSLLTTFSRDSVFRIKDPIGLIIEITRSL